MPWFLSPALLFLPLKELCFHYEVFQNKFVKHAAFSAVDGISAVNLAALELSMIPLAAWVQRIYVLFRCFLN